MTTSAAFGARARASVLWRISGILAVLFLMACGDGAGVGGGSQTTGDTGTDSGAVADQNVTTDTTGGGGEDGVATDTTTATPDATTDAATDAAAPETAPDTDDATAEVAPEVGPDAEPETTAEVTPDTAPETAGETVQDVAAETAGETAVGPDTDDAGSETTLVADIGDAGGETTAPDAGPACPGATGCACKEAKDCTSGECGVNLLGKPVCVANCGANDACAAGFACAKAAGKALCLEQDIALCSPCKANDQCAQPSAAGKAGACVAFGNEGSFCGFGCLLNLDCPDGYSCADGTDVAGAKGKFCKPKDNAVCKCSPAAIAVGASTTCSNGACKADRTCTAAGLTPCTAATPSVELCDGVDNDCSGTVDDKAGLCDDNNVCTADSCAAKDGCKNAALPDTATCTDGDECTTDGCKAGKCVSSAAGCDDKNPCTKDGCDSKGGCTNVADDTQACSDGDACTKDVCKAAKCLSDNGACDDGNLCTLDSCDKQKGCQNTPKPAGDCDDKNPCSTDSCDPAKGCQSAPIPNCVPGDLYKTDFACTATDWKLDGKPANSTGGWGLDATPNPPGAKSAACALNFNNGNDFECVDPATGGGIAKSYATGPVLDLGKLDPKAQVKVKFWLAGMWENGSYDNLVLELSLDGGATWAQLVDLDNPVGGGYAPRAFLLPNAAGKKIQLRFAFNTTDCIGNATPGPFIDDLTVVDATCKDDKGCDDSDPCTTDSCTVATGACTYAPSTAACDDGDPCSIDDKCAGGKCGGAPAMTGPCDDKNGCTSNDKCSDGFCQGTPAAGKCDDNNKCTTDDACNTGGFCTGAAVPCDDKNSCTTDTCDKLTGQCVFKPIADGTTCNDGDPCTKLDHCENVKCVAAPSCDDGNPCTDDKCTPNVSTYTCAAPNSPDGTPCSDIDACTAGDQCTAGKCAGTAGPCSVAYGMAIACTEAQAFVVAPLPESPTHSGWSVDASPLPPGYKSAACSLNFNNGTNFTCQTGQTKVAGTATLGAALDLTGGKQAVLKFWSWAGVNADNYTDQRWVEVSGDDFKTVALSWKLDNSSTALGAWKLLAMDLSPLAGKAVKVRFRFDSLNCVTNTGVGWFVDDLVVITDKAKGCAGDGECGDGNACTDDKCVNGACQFPFNKLPCDDGSKCTTGDLCNGAGGCLGPTPTNCNDNAACTIDSCDPVIGCKYANADEGFSCGDSDNCTIDDNCKGGKCVGRAKCDDANPCTTDSCAATSGACTNTPLADNASCSDNDPCTAADACKAGKCVGAAGPCSSAATDKFDCGKGGWVVPPPADPTPAQWAIDSSAASPGYFSPLCSLNFNNSQNFACPTGASKVEGSAVSAKTYSLLGAKAALLKVWSWAGTGTPDAADLRWIEASADDFKTVPVSLLLDNDSTNTQWKQVAVDLTPLAGKEIKVRFRFDSVNCNVNSGAGWFVDDLSIWTDVALACQTDANCGDGDACTKDTCASGKCTYAPLVGTPCEDGNPCSLADTCKAGSCAAGPGKVCNDNEACTSDSCNPAVGCVYTPLNDAAICSDGNACTDKDACAGGKCTGLPVADNLVCNDGDACSVGDACASGKCVPKMAAADGASCSTSDGCVAAGPKCLSGKCQGGNACDDGNPCTLDNCTQNGPGGKTCANVPMAEDAPCSDGDQCTINEACKAGVCKAATSACTVAASFPMDCNTTGWTMSAASSGSVWAFDATPNPPAPKSAPCSLNFNNGVDFAGTVKGTADSPAITIEPGQILKWWTYYDSETGSSYDKKFVEFSTDNFVTTALSFQLTESKTKLWYQPAPISLAQFAGKTIKLRFRFDSGDSAANNGAGWFIDDVSISTVANAGCMQDSECPPDAEMCTVEKCDKAKCVSEPLNGNLCNDGDVCTQASACQAGVCKGSQPIVCDDGDKCTADSCDAKTGCKYAYINGCSEVKPPYANDFKCTDPMTSWLILNDPPQPGPAWKVDAKPNPPGFLSPDCSLNFNNDVDFQCPTGATKVGGKALSPVIDATGYTGTKLHVKFQYSGAWENNSFDNLDVALLPVNSTATAVTATYDSANYWKVVQLDASKFIGQRFRVKFSFAATNCTSNATVGAFIENLTIGDASCKANGDCNDSNPCTTDTCTVSSGACVNAANTDPCDDGNACTLADKCGSSACAGIVKVCNDNNTCTTDSCVPASGDCTAVAMADGAICSDDNDCTTAEGCKAGKCIGGQPKADKTTCTDNNACTAGDVCQVGVCTGASNVADGTTCNDNNPCLNADLCKTGKCGGTTPACDDKNPCTTDACSVNGSQALCTFTPQKDGATCDDGNPCTDGDVCTASACKGPTNICKPVDKYVENFTACGNTAGWTLSAKGSNGTGWGIDDTPKTPAAFSPTCSLNFNDGSGYGGTGGVSSGTATSPEIDLTVAGPTVLTFQSYSGVQENNFELRTVEVLVGTTVVPAFKVNVAADLNKWVQVTVDLSAHAGKKIKIRFNFNTQDGFGNSGPGWFVDDIKVVAQVPPTVHKVTTSGFTFTPTPLAIAAGDSVEFALPGNHNVVEVAQSDWEAGDAVPVPDGFSVGFGQTKKVTFAKAGTYYYVCAPHASFGMKGQIIVK